MLMAGRRTAIIGMSALAVSHAAAGVADRATATPLTADAGLRIASNTKTVTAAAILRLVEQGQLQLDGARSGEPGTACAHSATGYGLLGP
jgi:CubicO group peptidase (beta-lactamase class C family)